MANQAIKNKTLGELLNSLTNNFSYEGGGRRYFTDSAAIAENHTRLKTLIGTNAANGDLISYVYNAQIADVAINPAGSLTWAELINGAAGAGDFTINSAPLNNGGGEERQQAVNVINGSGRTPSTLGTSDVIPAVVSNNHIIARIRQEIGAGANDTRILELIRVMQDPNGNANPNDNQANEILYAIKRSLGSRLNSIIAPIITQLDAKIAALKQLHNSAAKRDIAELEQIKKEVKNAQFKNGDWAWRVGRPNNHTLRDEISKFKKSLDILEGVHVKMQTYNADVPNLDEAVAAIHRYNDLLRRDNSTEQDIDDAYNHAHAQCTHNPRFNCYLEELIESRENYFAQLKKYDEVKNAQQNALEVAQHLHPKKNLAKAVGVSFIGVTLAAATAALLRLELQTPAVAATPATVHWDASTGNSVTIPAQPEQPAAITPSEGVCIAVVCILILAATAYIAYHYASRYKEDKALDPSLNESLFNIDEIDTDKSKSQIQEVRTAVAAARSNVDKRLLNQDGHSLYT